MTEADKYVVLRLSQGHGVDADARSLKNAAIAPNDKVRASNASEVTNVQQSNSGARKSSMKAIRPKWTEYDLSPENTTDQETWESQLYPSIFHSCMDAPEGEAAPHDGATLDSEASQMIGNDRPGVLNPSTDEDFDLHIRLIADDILQRLKTTDTCKANFTEVQTYVRQVAMKDQRSSRAIQLVLHCATEHESNLLFKIFREYTLDASRSHYGNFIIQEFIRLHPPARVAWIPRSLAGRGVFMAGHRLGCRIMCRLLEHYSERDLEAVRLFTEVFKGTPQLLDLKYGHHVAKTGLEVGIQIHRQMILESIWTNVHDMARGKHSSDVVETALDYCNTWESDWLAYELLKDTPKMIETAQHSHGWKVAKTLLRKTSSKHAAVRVLKQGRYHLSNTKGGKYVLKLADEIWTSYERI